MSLQDRLLSKGHASSAPRSCTSCGFSTRHLALYERHIRRCTSTTEETCLDGSTHKISTQPHLVNRNYRCKQCHFTTTKSKMFLFHQKESHGENINIFPCDICEYASRYKCKVLRHRKFIHPNAKDLDANGLQQEDDEILALEAQEDRENMSVLLVEGSQEHGSPAGEEAYGSGEEIHEEDEEEVMVEEEATHIDVDGEIKIRIQTEQQQEQDVNGNDIDQQTMSLIAELTTPQPKPNENAFDYIRKLSDSPGGPVFQCRLCTYTNMQKWKVANHVRSFHMKKKMFKCEQCDFVTSRKIEFCIHKTKHSRRRVFACDECGYKTTAHANFERHLANHKAESPRKCILCSYSSTGEAAIQQHMQEYHNAATGGTTVKLSGGTTAMHQEEGAVSGTEEVKQATSGKLEEDIPCPLCELVFKSESRLKIHLVSHSSESSHQCPLCILKYKRASDLNRHMKRKHNVRLRDYSATAGSGGGEQDEPLNLSVKRPRLDPASTEDQPLDLSVKEEVAFLSKRGFGSPPIVAPENLKCSHCSYLAKWPSDLHRHMLVHSVEKRFKCTYCHRRYKYKFDLNMHLRKMHKVAAGRTKVPPSGVVVELSPQDKVPPPTPPSLAPRAVATISPAPSDAYSNDGGESIKSTDSEISPASIRSLANSPASTLRKPLVIHPLRPSAAEKLLKSPRQLNLTPSGKFKCEFCPYLGACRSEVNRHMRLHTGEKPYSCLFCSYKSHWKGDMKRHIQKHHGEQYRTENDMCEIMQKTYKPDQAFEHINLNIETKPVVSSLRPCPSPTQSEKQSESQVVPPNAVVTSSGEIMQAAPGKAGTDMSPKKQNTCPYCPFVCEAPSKLKCHMEIHENLKRFKCAYCGKRSNWTWDVRKHIKKEHPGVELNVTVMSEEEARTTLPDYLQMHKSPVRRVLEFNAEQDDSSCDELLPPPDKEKEAPSPEPSATSELIDITSVMDDGSNANEILEKFLAPPPREPSLPPPPQMFSSDSLANSESLSMVTSESYSMAPIISATSKASSSYAMNSSMRSGCRSAATERYRPFKCSKCGKRSNWRWDLRKHIRQAHPTARVIEMTREEAMASWPPEKPKLDDSYQLSSDQLLAPLASYMTHAPVMSLGMMLPVSVPSDGPPTFHPLAPKSPPTTGSSASSKYVQQVDLKRLKRFKCHLCPYRSNYRSDIGRHSKRLHHKSPYKVIVLDEKEAASTLAAYKDTFGHKKFVLSPARSRTLGKASHSSLGVHTHETRHRFSLEPPKQEEEMPPEQEAINEEEEDVEIPEKELLSEIKVEQDGDSEPESTMGGKVKVWKCSRCDYRNTNKQIVLQHLRSHPKVKVFRCRMCGEESDYRNSIYRHIRNRHNTTDYSAAVIESVAFIDPKTKAHLGEPVDLQEEAAGDKVYRCMLCGQTSKWKAGILKHVGEKHPAQDVYSVLEEVEGCSSGGMGQGQVEGQRKATETTSVVARHTMPMTMSPPKNLHCSVCPYKTNKAGLLNFHSAYHKPQPGHKYKCKYCPYYVSAPRLLHQHVRLHVGDKLGAEDAEPVVVPELEGSEAEQEQVDSERQQPKSPPHEGGGRKHFSCDQCPFMCRNKNDFIYHKQFHKEKPTAPFKCQHCNYWVAQRRLLAQHNRVHAPEYAINFRNGNAVRGVPAPLPSDPVVTSPAKSESDIDSVDIAEIKQSIITSKIYSTPITPEKFESRGADKASPSDSDKDDAFLMEGYLVNKSGHLLKSGALRKMHKCAHCPYTNVRATNLRLHESMHGFRPGKDLFKCPYCDYHVGNKGLLSHHVKVHSNKYEPGKDEIDDIEYPEEGDGEEEANSRSGDECNGEETGGKSAATEKDEVPEIIDTGPQLEAGSLPHNTEFYIKYDNETGDMVMERVNVKKWCCEKCPFATMKRVPFERHMMLHNSKQQYVCDYCDYAVPAYHLLLQHKKLHLRPNPNLLSLQSIANLHRLPELPADLAAAANFPASTADPASLAGTHDKLNLYENSDEFIEPTKMYRCDRCPYTNVHRSNLLAHLKFHMVPGKIRCSYCDYSVDKEHMLIQHVKVHFTNALDLFDSPTKSSREDEITEQDDKFKEAKECQEEATKKVDEETEDDKDQSVGSNSQPEYIDLADLEKVADVEKKPESNNNNDNNNNNDEAEKNEVKKEKVVKIGREEGRSRKSVPVRRVLKEEGESSDETMWICQYCDRAFNASEKLLRHEMQHLVGNNF